MSSKNNPSSCRVAYPLCPTDAEQLVYYLNNHNGGFFRFFNAPQNNQQNINQFYNQLSQNYNNQQNQFPQNFINNNFPYQYNQQNQINGYPVQKYGNNYPYNKNNDGLNKIRFKNLEENTIEERIQNRPGKYLDDFEDNLSFENIDNTKWSFPDDINTKVRVGKGLKFPDESYFDKDIREVNREESKRDPRGFKFPDTRNIEYINKYQELDSNYNYNSFNNLNSDIYKGYSNNYNEHKEDQSVRTVYVVRGNGDPNHPEIIKLRPGQTIY
ncbi:PREDICTED: putative mediator of RNA polymerase II transcription subunit 26 [Papilio polytes]|uniref:putative mediator of RNA polymerase II transcription subunit 26 n=1 Tax=Papilio polytes TaxID=76194 RepID=UPI000676549F|nr:PREDICTED: putative mediator of RNA polymerase II transcription subunit 26 [Papilio polytes]